MLLLDEFIASFRSRGLNEAYFIIRNLDMNYEKIYYQLMEKR